MKLTKFDLLCIAPIYLELMCWTFGDNVSGMMKVNGIVLVVLFVCCVIIDIVRIRKSKVKMDRE